MRRYWWSAVLLVVGMVCPAGADGPHIAFHATEGCCTVTVFTAPDPLVAGPMELDVLVQRASDGSLVPGAVVSGRLTLAGHPATQFAATGGGGTSNPGLPGAMVQLAVQGDYALELQVQGAGGAAAQFAGTLPVAANRGVRNTILWAVFVPLVLALLFLANQQGKFRMRRQKAATGVTILPRE